MVLELENLDKNSLIKLAHYFSINNNLQELLLECNVIEDNTHGTLFLESKIKDSIKFSIQRDSIDPALFSSITFYQPNISIGELLDIYPIYHGAYIPYDEEYCYVFKSINGKYNVTACINKAEENKDKRDQLPNRLSIIFE
jgi:hypothetical protein